MNAYKNQLRSERAAYERPKSSVPRPDRNNGYTLTCTCNDPNLLCPIIAHRPGLTPKTDYQAEFVPYRLPHNVQYRPVDNLKINKASNDEETIYQQDYKPTDPKILQKYYKENKNLQEKFTDNNHSHIKNLIYLPGPTEKYQERHRDSELYYEKPAKFIKQKEKIVNNYPFERETEYTRTFKGLKRDRSVDARLNYDNLYVYPNLHFKGTTEYKDKMVMRPNDPSPNKILYQLNKQTNHFAHTLDTGYYAKVESEYDRNFKPRDATPPKHQLPYKNFVRKEPPPIPPEFQHLSEYLYFDEKEGVWKLRKVPIK